MTKLDESAIIKIFQKKLGKKYFVSEDVEIFSLGKTKIAAKTDTLGRKYRYSQKNEISGRCKKKCHCMCK